MSRHFAGGNFAVLDGLLQHALDLDATQREAFIKRIEREQPEHAVHLRAMLSCADANIDPLDDLLDQRLWAELADDPAAGQCFGSWRARGTIAHGGMARVLYAERVEGGFEQFAAIKCLWPGLATPELIARFEQERQILARLDDPRIARLLDGGVRADGIPWLALEYVAGRALDVHCNDQRLSVDARIALWNEVALAVATAHRLLIVHRDLKPSNVLVNEHGAVKLLDFGIAKLLDSEGLASTQPPTKVEAQALTREYASPEQLRGDSITTVSDVYQLGLLLHALICGARAFRGDKRREPDDDAVAPSVALRHDKQAELHALQRASTAARLARRLRGDLDAIVQRALAPSPTDRYGSVDALREDLDRWRRGAPVRARRIGPLRRSGKWLRRHAWFAAGSAALVCLALAYAFTSYRQAQTIASEAAINRAVRDRLVDWFQAGDPGGGQDQDPRASELLASGLAQLRRDQATPPALRAEMLGIIGEIYLARGESARAEPVLVEASALYQQLPVQNKRQQGASTTSLATMLAFTSRYAEAETRYRQALAERMAAMGSRAHETLSTRLLYADLLHSRGRYDEAKAQVVRAMDDARKSLEESDPMLAMLQNKLANISRDKGNQSEAAALYAKALVFQLAAHGEFDPRTASSRLGLGRVLLDQGLLAEAATQIDKAFAVFQEVRGQTTPATAYCERIVAQLEEARGDLDAAARRLQRLNDQMKLQLSVNHIILGYLEIDLGYVELSRGNDAQAQEQFAQAKRIFDSVQPDGHPRHIEILLGQALLAQRSNDPANALRLLAAAHDQATRQLAPEHPMFVALGIAEGRATPDLTQPVGLNQLRVARAMALQ
jgi:serine/threonine-protein kinase